MALDDDIRTFLEIPLFRLLERDAVRLLAFSAETKLLRAGDVLFRSPATVDSGNLLIKGALAIFDNPDQIGAPRQVARAPALVGELAMITATEFTGSVVAREPSTVLRISRTVFHRVLAEYPRSAQAVREALVTRLKGISREMEPLATF
ncbi:MAG: cyclic nucleotide-binding domain-containing protein [Beijerinckiaceae bacterium]